jgi:DNA-binding NtrC family response regulator
LKVLIVDDNRSAADALRLVLKRHGYPSEAVYGGAEAIVRLDAGGIDAVVTDLRMEPVDGMAVLAHARGLPAPPEVLVVTGYGTVDAAVEAMRMGARDFLTKPVAPDQLVARLEALVAGEDDLPVATGTSPAAKALRARLAAVSGVRSSVLLRGEPGSGRRWVAAALHRAAGGRLVVLAHPGRSHREDLAGAGVLLLPGVDHLDEGERRQLLRALDALDEGTRVVAAAGAGWGPAEAGELYYRLAVLVIDLPPLRERAADIPALVEQLVEQRAKALGRAPILPDPRQLAALQRYAWPGNLRELAAVVERALVFGPGAWEVAGAPASAAPGAEVTLGEGFSLAQHLEDIERALLERALEEAGGDRVEVARLLGLERNTLRYKLNKYGLLGQK